VKRGLLVYNPTAGQRDRRGQMSALIDRMRREGLELVNAPTTGRGHATDIVRAFLPRGLDVVAVCGGDGTICEVVSGLFGTTVPLAVIPCGTSNVLARELAIPLDLAASTALLLGGKARPVRVLLANDRPFLLWAGVGLDARIMGNMKPLLKRWLGRAGIFFTVAPEFFRYEFPRLEVAVDGARHEATFAVVCHARHYAGDWIIAPEASLDSDEMEVLLFCGRSRWEFFTLFRKIRQARGEHLESGLARTVKGRIVAIRSLERYAVEAQIDGDCVLETPITCRASDATVSILVPEEEPGLPAIEAPGFSGTPR
jgi:diacylglycerol kinase family enzyme